MNRENTQAAVLIALAFALFATGCGEEPLGQRPSPEPLTWKEWRAERRAVRLQSDYGFWRNQGLPDMRGWRPDDFLPSYAMQTEHVDMCSLPIDKRELLLEILRGLSLDASSGEIEELLDYARAGVVQAQAALAEFCVSVPDRQNPRFGHSHAMLWVQKGAASGNPYAMNALANCLEYDIVFQSTSTGRSFSSRLFVWDQFLYWKWRSARAMNDRALRDMARETGILYEYPSRRESLRHKYKWSRLYELFATLNEGPRDEPRLFGARRMAAERQLPAAEVAKGEALVAQWLQRRLPAFSKYRAKYGCPDETWSGGDPLHYTAFNKELAQYGLSVDPTHAERWRPPTYGSGRAAAEGAN